MPCEKELLLGSKVLGICLFPLTLGQIEKDKAGQLAFLEPVVIRSSLVQRSGINKQSPSTSPMNLSLKGLMVLTWWCLGSFYKVQLMIEILHDFMYQNPGNCSSIE